MGARSESIRTASPGPPWAASYAVPRASHVEFDVTEQRWVARDAWSGRIAASGQSRETVLREEHEHYTREIAAGRYPR